MLWKVSRYLSNEPTQYLAIALFLSNQDAGIAAGFVKVYWRFPQVKAGIERRRKHE